MSEIQKGHQITSAFLYIQQVFHECQRIIFKIDNELASEWRNLYGNRITRDVSSNLQDPDTWLPEAIFRSYEDINDKRVSKAITIAFWGEDIEQPVITAGKIVYKDVEKRGHWDLWNIWYGWEAEDENYNFELDGKVNVFKTKDVNYIEEALVFSLPLIDISDEEALMEKVIKPLKEL